MKKHNRPGRLAALLLALLLWVQAAAPALAAGDTVAVSSAEDLLALARSCTLDAWSRGKTVVLTADISLASADFLPIPTFGGTFEGGGHTISGLDQSGKLSPAGLFGVLQEGAEVRDLNVSGSVTPSGTAASAGGVAGENYGLISRCTFSGAVTGENNVGGIAGTNGLSGKIENCSVSGRVTGKSRTGGIAGNNLGVLASCENQSYVNITNLDPGISLSELELSTGLFTLRSMEAVNIATDTGGVAGYSSGMLLSCVNAGVVGCRHVGYNVGGVAGRSCGLISACVNRGQVFGRKDIGGVVGQAEPYIVLNLSEDTLDTLRAQLTRLEQLVDQAARDAQSASADVSGQFAAINDCLDTISLRARTLSERISGYGGDVTAEIDRGSDILADALDQLSAVAKTADGLAEKVAGALNTLSRAAREMSGAGENVSLAAGELEAASNSLDRAGKLLGQAASKLEEGVGRLSDIVQNGGTRDDVKAALDLFQTGLDILAGDKEQGRLGVADELEQATDRLKAAARELGWASDEAQEAMDTLADAIDALSRASRQSEEVFGGARDLIDFLAQAEPLQFAQPDEAIGSASDGLFDALDQLGGLLDGLNAAASSSADRLAEDVRAINSQFSALMNTLIDAVYGLENTRPEDRFTDTSGEDVEAVTSGKVRACTNEGEVSGDLCAGGVAGSLAVEYELDPEDDALSSGTPAYRRAYELKAILQKCVNTGSVSVRRNWAGSICGRMSLGLAVECVGCGSVESVSGDYVGGIAGFCTGAVRSCWSKCTLSGGSYVGGIVGAAGLEGDSGGGVVTGCRSFVQIPRYEQYAGAVSGVDRGSFQDNRFVSDTLAGVGRVSLAGQAEPAAYEDLLREEELPGAFRRFTLRFLAGGVTVKSLTFRYGESFGAAAFPEIPEKSGCFARWDTEELTGLRFDTDVAAVYAPYLTALPSEERREDGRPLLFAEGQFCSGDGLSIQPGGEADIGSTPLALRRVVETLRLELPDDGERIHTLRYLSASGSPDGLEVYAREGGFWVRLETESVGSYLVFDAAGSAPELAVAARTSLWWVWLLAAAGGAGLAVLAVRLGRRKKKSRQRPPEASGEEKAAPAPRKRRGLLAAACVLVLCLGAAGAYLVLSGLWDGAAAARLAYRCAREPELSMSLTVQAGVGGRRLSAGAQLQRTQWEGRRVTCARQSGASVYYCGGTVYLENGCALQVGSGLFPDYGALLDTVRALCRSGEITVFQNGGEKIYTLKVRGEGAAALVNSLLPSAEELAWLEELDMDLVSKSGALSEVRFQADGVLSGGERGSLSAKLAVLDRTERLELPAAVQEAIRAGDGDGAKNTEDLARLLAAWGRLNLTDPLSAQLTLSADCGPLVLDDELELFRTWLNGKQVGCVRRAGRSLYFTDGLVCDEHGAPVDVGESGLADREKLLELAYQLSLQGTAGCEETEDGWLYTLTLDEAEQVSAAQGILPDLEALDVEFTAGRLEILVRDGGIESLRLSCGGELRLLSLSVPVEAACEMRFEAREFVLPEEVAGAMGNDLSG